MDVSKLPALNAALNATSATFLILGVIFIRQRLMKSHTMCMITAFITSTLFLISYLTYHFYHGSQGFQGQGPIRIVYFAILISHTILAVAVPPLAILSLWRGLTGNFIKHTAVARIAFPIWLYVSVTGVLIYLMLYHWFKGV